MRSKHFILLGILAFLSSPILYLWSLSYQSQAELRMLFWQAKGTVKVPAELDSESNTRDVLLSSTVRERVNRRLPWKLSEREYSQAVNLSSNRLDWNPRRELTFRVFAVSNNPENTKLLCTVASEELSTRCQELAQEFEQQLWDLEILKVQSALGQWKFQHRAKPPSPQDIRRLKLSIAAAQLKLRDLKDNPNSGSDVASQRVKELRKGLKELQAALDELWLQGTSGEIVADLESEFRDRQLQLKAAIDSKQSALVHEAQELLVRLERQKYKWGTQTADQALDQLTELRTTLGTLNRAKDLTAMHRTMYCLVYRPAGKGQLLATELKALSPSLLALLLVLVCVWGRRRQERDMTRV